SMGMASSRSRPLPCGTPSMMSIRTTSASSFDAIQWAAVAPTFPDPTMLTFLRMISLSTIFGFWPSAFTQQGFRLARVKARSDWSLSFQCWLRRSQNAGAHVLDNLVSELAGTDLGCALHESLKVVGYSLFFDGPFQATLDQIGGLIPSQEAKHHHA